MKFTGYLSWTKVAAGMGMTVTDKLRPYLYYDTAMGQEVGERPL